MQSLFTGLGDRPSKFLEKPPRPFDEQLPIITDRDLQELREQIPELAAFLESSSLNVSMKDDTRKASFLQSEELENLSALQFAEGLGTRTSGSISEKKETETSFGEMSSSQKATQMSIDASTQVEWTCEEEKTPVKEEQGVPFYSTQHTLEKHGQDERNECSDDNGSHERKKSSSDTASERSSALDDSDLVFRSAHEDYVTVFDADLGVNLEGDQHGDNIQPVGELQEDCAALLDDASQTPTLTGSATQSTDNSTQTEHSSDNNLTIQESGLEEFCEGGSVVSEHKSFEGTDQSTENELVERLKLLEEQLRTTQSSLENAFSQKEQLRQVSTKVRDCLVGEFEVIRQGIEECRQVIVGLKSKMKEDVVVAIASLQQKGDLYRETVIENTTKKVRGEYEKELVQLNMQFEQEKAAFLQLKSELEFEKNAFLEELKQLQSEKETSESKHREEAAKLSLIVSEYKAKIEEREGVAQKLQENKSRYEEDQQIRFNAIMMKLKREKESALSQAQEKIKALRECIEQQEKDIKSLVMEKEKVVEEYEQERDAFCVREQELLAGEEVLSCTLNKCFSVISCDMVVSYVAMIRAVTQCFSNPLVGRRVV